MARLRWRISDLLALVLFVGIALGGYCAFWRPSRPNAGLLLSLNLAILTTATLGSRFANLRWRRFWLGYASFGWVCLVCVLHGGFGVETGYDAEALAENSLIGIVFGVLCGITSLWFLVFPVDDQGPAKTRAAEDPVPERSANGEP